MSVLLAIFVIVAAPLAIGAVVIGYIGMIDTIRSVINEHRRMK
jgi:hypothetical protein